MTAGPSVQGRRSESLDDGRLEAAIGGCRTRVSASNVA